MSLLQPQTGKVPVPHPGTLTQPYWDVRARRAAVPTVRGLWARHAHARVPVLELHVAEPHLGEERGHGRGLQLDHGVAAADAVVRGALRRDHRRHARGLADPL